MLPRCRGAGRGGWRLRGFRRRMLPSVRDMPGGDPLPRRSSRRIAVDFTFGPPLMITSFPST